MPSGRYRARVTDSLGDRVVLDGSPFDTPDAAWQAVHEFYADTGRGQYVPRADAQTPLKDVWSSYLAGLGGKPNTVKDRQRFEAAVITGTAMSKTQAQRAREETRYRTAVKAHTEAAQRAAAGLEPRRGAPLPQIVVPSTVKVERMILGAIPVGRVTSDIASRWVRSLVADGIAPVTIDKWWGYLHQVLKHAKRQRMILEIPIEEGSPLPRGTLAQAKKPHYFLTLREMVELTLGARPHEALLIEAVLWSGLRSGEVRGLAEPAILDGRGLLSVEASVSDDTTGVHWLAPKTLSSMRHVPIPTPITYALAREGRGPGVPIFEGAWGTWMRGGVLNDAWNRARTSAGLLGHPADPSPGRRKAPTPHDARATGASLLFALGASVPEVQQWLGHSNAILTLNVYSEVQRWGMADPVVTEVKNLGLPLPEALNEVYRQAWDVYGPQVANDYRWNP